MFPDQRLSLIETLNRKAFSRMNPNSSASVSDKRTFQSQTDLAADSISTGERRRLQNAVRVSEER